MKFFVCMLLTSMSLGAMEREKVILKVINRCIEQDPIKEQLTPSVRTNIENYYSHTYLTLKSESIKKTTQSINSNLSNFLYNPVIDETARTLVINTFVKPFIEEDKQEIYRVLEVIDPKFLEHVVPGWMEQHAHCVDIDRSNKYAFLYICLYCALHVKRTDVIIKIIIADLCDLKEINLSADALWAEELLAFVKKPQITAFIQNKEPNIEELLRLFLFREDLLLNELPELCAYIANPKASEEALYDDAKPKKRTLNQTYLMWACKLELVSLVKLLLLQNNNPQYINLHDELGNSALTYAAQQANKEIITLLLEEGATANMQILFTAADSKKPALVKFICTSSKNKQKKATIVKGVLVIERSS